MKFVLELEEPDVLRVIRAVGKMPAEEVFNLLVNIDSQIKAQQQAAHDRAADERDQPSGARPAARKANK